MKKLSVNMMASLLLQVCTIVSGLIVPRLILQTFGSSVNGLVSSVSQFSNYIVLLEGGVSSVMLANLYQPLYAGNSGRLSSVFAAMELFFKRLSLILLAYQAVLATAYAFFVDTGFSWGYVFSLTLILGVNLFVQYNFSASLRLLLEADSKLYITKMTQTAILILNTVFVYIGIKLYPNIHIVKLITAAVYLLQPVCYRYYVNRKYSLDKSALPDSAVMKQRWDGFGINLAAFVHNNTDIALLTFFSGLLMVSVYNVYVYVVSGIKLLTLGILAGFIPLLGRNIALGDKKALHDFFEKYEFFSVALVVFSFSLGSMLIMPFERLYTHNINDADYAQPLFAALMLLAEGIYCVREPYVNLAYQSNRFKEVKKYAYAEALINITASLLLVGRLGLVGVAVGTLAAMLYRTACQIAYAGRLLGKRMEFLNYIAAFAGPSLLGNALIRRMPAYQCSKGIEFVVLAICAASLLSLLYLPVALLYYCRKFKRKRKGGG